MIKATIIKDSINPNGNRLTTFVLKYPRIVHSEFMTHRMISKNSASSRAIPSTKFLKEVRETPAMPVFWGTNQPGMQAAAEADDTLQDWTHEWVDNFPPNEARVIRSKVTHREYLKRSWVELGKIVADFCENRFQKAALHKQIANRPMEAWFHMEVIASATNWENFFALRCHPMAQPEIQALADAMLLAYVNNKPVYRQPGEWHLPFEDEHMDPEWPIQKKIMIATARCARVSYKNFDGKIDPKDDEVLYQRLCSGRPGHWSPFEHPARAMSDSGRSGNFSGWHQHRKDFAGEDCRVNVNELLQQRIASGSRFAQGATE